MTNRTHRANRVLRVALLCIALGYPAFGNASVISLNFLVEVTKRELHNGPGGQSGYNWVEDTSYAGEQFDLSFQIDTGNIQSNSGLVSLSAEAPVLGSPATPFDAEIDAALAGWGWTTLKDDFNFSTSQSSKLTPLDALTGSVSLYSNTEKLDGPDGYYSTSGMFRNTYLATANDFLFVTLDDLLNGTLITESDLLRLLTELQSTGAPLFDFQQRGGQWQGNYPDFFFGIAYVEGVQYSGTARVKSADIPMPATSWLLLVGVFAAIFRPVRRP